MEVELNSFDNRKNLIGILTEAGIWCRVINKKSKEYKNIFVVEFEDQ